jgi:hypothetical protein
VAGALWALVLLPPQVVAWDGEDAPGWLQSLAELDAYDLPRQIDGVAGVDYYGWAGVLVAPAWLLIGWALLGRRRTAGAWVGAVAWLLLLGAPVSVVSYLSAARVEPWSYLWGAEIPLLLAIPLVAIVAGVRAVRRHGMPRWWGVLLGCTLLVVVGSTLLLGYFPHGTLVGLGAEVAVLAARPGPLSGRGR